MIDRSTDPPFISLGSPRGVAITSLDKYIQQRRQIRPAPLLPPDSPRSNPKDSIANLQKEQSVLCEDLNAERRRGDNLLSTFKRAQTLSSSQFVKKIKKIEEVLSKIEKPSNSVTETLRMINDMISRESEFVPGTLRASAMSPSKMKSDGSGSKISSENERIETEIKKINNQKDEMLKRLEELNAEIEKTSASKKKIVDKLKYYYDTFKKRDAAWKQKANKIQELVQTPQ